MISTVLAADIPAVAGQLVPLLAPAVALNSGRMTAEDVVAMAALGQAQIWTASAGREMLGAGFGYPVRYRRRKSLCIPYVAGRERERWEAEMLAAMERAARRIGCDLIEGIGRRGFARILPGFEMTGWAYEKDLG